MIYETVIGLEIHAELSTATKLFCGCAVSFGEEPNTKCCPICIGMPGVLPLLNKTAVEYCIMTGLTLNCEISLHSKFDRKNYFYPDLPKAYQVSQYDLPFCSKGHLEYQIGEVSKKVGITRIHLEEDAGKLIHDRSGFGSLIDYNRSGVPLIEIVTQPDIRSSEEAKLFLEALKSVLEYIEVSDCKMQEGSLRCDVNISLREKGSIDFGKRVEIKNLNSFRSIVRAIEYETKRQKEILDQGGTIVQETRRWDEINDMTYSMRSKEDAHDYKYFPEPDLLPVIYNNESLNDLMSKIPELPLKRKNRLIEKYSLSSYDASVLTSSKNLADLFDRTVYVYPNPKIVANWLMGEYLRIIKDKNLDASIKSLDPNDLAKLLVFIDNGDVSLSTAKTVFEEMIGTKAKPEDIISHRGLSQIKDSNAIEELVDQILRQNPKSIEDYNSGKTKSLGFLVGQAMRASLGKANPQLLNEILIKKLDHFKTMENT